MTKKAKSSKKSFKPRIFLLPYLGIAYGLFPDRKSLDEVLDVEGIPRCIFNTELKNYAATYKGTHNSKSYAFVFAEELLNANASESEKLSIIAHEAYHVVCHMLELMGEDSPSEEFVAYTLSDVCENLYSQYFGWRDLNGN